MSQVLADETTLGYEDQCNLRLLKFNQQPVRNLRHLADMVYHCKEAYMRFDLEWVFCPVLLVFSEAQPELLLRMFVQSRGNECSALCGVLCLCSKCTLFDSDVSLQQPRHAVKTAVKSPCP